MKVRALNLEVLKGCKGCWKSCQWRAKTANENQVDHGKYNCNPTKKYDRR